jgi:GH25 family lysozyme M1 (1,4-beta-N-acetylmuramidase)
MGTNGVDLSAFQSSVTVKSFTGLDFVIAKATEGTTVKDPTYSTWAAETEDAGAQFGAYHFFHAENKAAMQEADVFCAYARPRTGLSLWLDYETYGASPEDDAAQIALFISTVKQNVGSQQKVGLYVNGTGLNRILPYRAAIGMSALWYAAPSMGMTDQGAAMKWEIHQYETLDGIDRNYSTWSIQDWVNYAAW